MLTKNPFRKFTKAWKFLEICNIDYETGYSDMISSDFLKDSGLGTINGGGWCRTDGPLGRYFNIYREKGKGKIVGVQLTGYVKNTFNSKIEQNIREFYKNKPCVVLNIRGRNIEIDHKDGRKDNYSPLDSCKDFQPMHRSVNLSKRQHCRACRETGLRFDARDLGYIKAQWVGNNEYQGSCIGCYWYDPLEYNKQISRKQK